MKFALLITLTIYSTNAMVNVVPSVNPHVFVREINELRRHNNYSPPQGFLNNTGSEQILKRKYTDHKISRKFKNLSIKAKASQSDFHKFGAGAIETRNSPPNFNGAVDDYTMKDQKTSEIHGLLTDQQTNRENYNKEKLKSSHFENKANTIEKNGDYKTLANEKQIIFNPNKIDPLNIHILNGHEHKTLDKGGSRSYISIEKRANSAPVIENKETELSQNGALEMNEFNAKEVNNFLHVMNRFISIGGLSMKDLMDVHGNTMNSQERINFIYAVKTSSTERMFNIVKDIMNIFEMNGIEDVKGVYSQLTSWAFGTFACNLPYSIKENNGNIVPFPTFGAEKELKMLLEMILYYNKENYEKIKQSATEVMKYISELFSQEEFCDGGFSDVFNIPNFKTTRINSSPAAIEFHEYLGNFPYDFEMNVKSPGIQTFHPHEINNYIINVLRYSEITTNTPKEMLQEAGKFFIEKEQRNEFISFLEYIKSTRLALISKDLFDIFEMHGIPEGEKRSQLCFWAINTFLLNLISTSTRKDRREIIYLYKFKVTREQISEMLKIINESSSNAEEKTKIRWSALNTAKYILEMFKKGKDVFDGGCKE
uniref:Uncharacterized protein n=1 Tax=Meloidogyne floridensis TaxID=298350 RepID=A0A915P931_9BILA